MRILLHVTLCLSLLSSCSGITRDYRESAPSAGQARIYIYRPHVWQVMWGEYEISVQGKPVKILEDEGYFHVDVPAGKTELRSKHVSDKEIVALDLNVKAGETHFVKLDPEAEKFTMLGAIGDVLAISTIVAGAKSQMRIESGQGNIKDVVNVVRAEGAKNSVATKRTLGHHVLLAIEAGAARKEIAACCSSEEVDEVD